jgi:hypothetical protein
MTKRGWKTAGEIVAELERNPEFVAHRAEQERRRQQIEDALRELEAPLVEALGQVGEHVKSVWDLVNTSRPYPLAIDVLLEHLQRPYPEQISRGSRARWPFRSPAGYGRTSLGLVSGAQSDTDIRSQERPGMRARRLCR